MEFYFLAWSKFFQFSGRSPRKEYWLFVIINAVIYVLLGLVGSDSRRSPSSEDGNIIQGLFSLLVLIPTFAVTVRRLHDTNRTGWLALLLLLPCIGPLILLVFNIQEGDIGENQYGPDPYEASEDITTFKGTIPSPDPKPILGKDRVNTIQNLLISAEGQPTVTQQVDPLKNNDESSQFLDKPRDQHYAFAHVYLRDKALSNPATTVHELSGENSLQYLKILWATEGLRSKAPNDEFIPADGLGCYPFTIADRSRGVIVKLPDPKGPAEAFMVAIVVPIDAEPGDYCSCRYLTLEFSPNRTNRTVLAEWTDGAHFNRGAGPQPNVRHFKNVILKTFDSQ